MFKNNPSWIPEVVEKGKQTRRINGTLQTLSQNRGGNGCYTKEQTILSFALGWPTEVPIKTADHLPLGQRLQWCRENKYPTCYKVDVGNKELKIAIEIDGRGHKLKERSLKDRKKEKKLKELGWKVLRFTNQSIMTNLSQVLSEIKNEIKAI
jgi:hypothetical protein